MSGFPTWTCGASSETHGSIQGRIGWWRIHPVSAGAVTGTVGHQRVCGASRAMMRAASPRRWPLCGAGVACSSIQRRARRGPRLGCSSRHGPVDGWSRIGKAAGRAASIRATTGTARRRQPGCMRAMCRLPMLTWGKSGRRVRLDEGFHSAAERRRKIRTGTCQRLSKRERSETPIAFRDLLLEMVGLTP